MNWFFSVIVFQFTILLLHGRPETSTSTATTSPERFTAKIEHYDHPSSVPSFVQASGNEPSSPSPSPSSLPVVSFPSAISSSESTKKQQLSTTAAISTPLLTTKRILSTMAQVKKVPPTKKLSKIPETTVSTTSTTAAALDSTAKTTRYYDRYNRTDTNIWHANQNSRIPKHHINSTTNNNNTVSNLRELRQQYVNDLNRQYLGNVYNINPYLTHLLTTPKSIDRFVASAPQQTYFIVHPDDMANFDQFQSNIQLENVGDLGPILNVGNPINTNLVNTFSASESYQLPRPPPLVVNNNLPSKLSPPKSPPLFHSTNITKLYSIIGSSTPDPYNNFQEVPLEPSLYGQQVVKFSVNSQRPYKPNGNRYGNGQNKRKPIYHTNNKNHENFTPNLYQVGSNPNGINKISIVYNESSQLYNTNKNENRPPADDLKANVKNETLHQNTPKECLVTPNTGNSQTENVCNSNDLKIIIKFDGGSILANATTEKNAVKPKPKKKNKRKPVIMTTTTTAAPPPPPAAAQFYDSLSYESNEISEESNELSGFFEPIQNVFGFAESSSSLERRPLHGHRPQHGHGNKDKNKHKHKQSGEVVNKYQTIILQTPPPPHHTTDSASSSSSFPVLSMKNHKKMLYKLFAILSMMAILKPLGFGLWTLILSPLLVITIGGVALGVILYPFLAIAKQQQIHYATARSPRIVIHKHPRPIKPKLILKRPQRPQRPNKLGKLGPGYVYAKWTEPARRRIDFTRQAHTISHKFNRRQQQPIKRIIPIRHRNFQARPRRHARDTEFQQWLLIQNNFNIRIMSPFHD